MHSSVRTLTKIAVLSAVAFVLMYFDFPLPFIPSFYKLDFSETAVMAGGFAMGPGAAVAIEGVKILLKLLFKGTDTAYVGELANFLIGCAFVLPASFMYRKEKTRQRALMGLAAGTVCMTAVGVIINYAVLLPAYSFFYQLPMEVLIGMGTALIPFITDKLTFVLLATTPFNIIKGVLVSIVTILLYKRISPLLHS
ncbi:MAG: ECF transporter S component [Solobacterium sp.]|nr:ECF transporter S component [Solobacterium sp.]MBQ6355745.1 ECF transporter S component [Solobacterium sp.]MBQ6532837.1 ECF transporter S component [Solobacterium sp.]MBR0214771.1 ECF transporter S component [Solobacterium sp.]